MDRSTFTRGLALTLFLSITALAAGCPGPEEVPPDAARPDRDAAVDAAIVADSGPGDAGTDAFSPDAFTFDAPGLDAYTEDAPSSDPDAFVCDDPTGCYRCTPTTSEQFLDRCTSASCEPFENTRARLPLLREDGTLPPLP
ncbi:MAG: hypothetical protein J0L92_17710 [Deltaproteobacteria bacterium]|nr:hypothetical protein [Deltaproteobacteria bacterium]